MAKIKSMVRWSAKEIETLQATMDKPAVKVAKMLKRTVIAVQSKRYAVQGRDLENSGQKWTRREIKALAKAIDAPNSKMSKRLQRSPKELNAMRHYIRTGKVSVA